MIDLHCHLLPGLDDGPDRWEKSLEMAKMALSDGIKAIVATPHYHPGLYQNSGKRIKEKVMELRHLLQEEGLSLEVLPGADVHLMPDLLPLIEAGEVMTVNDSMKYLLLELPNDFLPLQLDDIVFSLKMKGIVPIFSHVERLRVIQDNLERLYELEERGALAQITAMSLTGGFGKEARRVSQLLLEHSMVQVIASDAHNLTRRPPVLSPGLKEAAKIVGEEMAHMLVEANPEGIIKGEDLLFPEPQRPLRRKGLFWSFNL